MKDDEGPKLPTARMLDGVTIWNFPPIEPIGPLFREPNLIDYASALGVPAHLIEPESPNIAAARAAHREAQDEA